jgi:hypothetical protein
MTTAGAKRSFKTSVVSGVELDKFGCCTLGGKPCSVGDEFEGAQPLGVIVDIGHDHELVGACFRNERIDTRTNRNRASR